MREGENIKDNRGGEREREGQSERERARQRAQEREGTTGRACKQRSVVGGVRGGENSSCSSNFSAEIL